MDVDVGASGSSLFSSRFSYIGGRTLWTFKGGCPLVEEGIFKYVSFVLLKRGVIGADVYLPSFPEYVPTLVVGRWTAL